MTWKDAEDIALALMEAHPDVDPLTVRFTDLHQWVVALPGFARRRQELERGDPRGHPDEMARGIPGPLGSHRGGGRDVTGRRRGYQVMTLVASKIRSSSPG